MFCVLSSLALVQAEVLSCQPVGCLLLLDEQIRCEHWAIIVSSHDWLTDSAIISSVKQTVNQKNRILSEIRLVPVSVRILYQTWCHVLEICPRFSLTDGYLPWRLTRSSDCRFFLCGEHAVPAAFTPEFIKQINKLQPSCSFVRFFSLYFCLNFDRCRHGKWPFKFGFGILLESKCDTCVVNIYYTFFSFRKTLKWFFKVDIFCKISFWYTYILCFHRTTFLLLLLFFFYITEITTL